MVTLDLLNYRNSNSKILIECDLNTSDKCKKRYEKIYRYVLKSRSKNDGRDICTYCYNKSINIGNRNGAFRHKKNEDIFSIIDSEIKAYLLGLIAGDGSIENTGKRLVLYANECDSSSLTLAKSFISPTIQVCQDNKCMLIKINSTKIVSDVCNHLKIHPGKKCYSLSLPKFTDELIWHFLRGLMDSDGWISNPHKGCTSPRCKITSYSDELRLDIYNFCLRYDICSSIGPHDIYFTGKYALEFMTHTYNNSNFYLSRKFDRYKIWSTWIPQRGTSVRPRKQKDKCEKYNRKEGSCSKDSTEILY